MRPSNFHRVTTLDEAEEFCSVKDNEDGVDGLPAIIHFIWVGGEPPSRALWRMYDWAWLHPYFAVCLWGEEALTALANSSSNDAVGALMDAAPNAAALSDVGRFAILNRLGGVYLDADMEVCRPIGPLVGSKMGFIVRESKWLLVASAMGLSSNSVFGGTALQIMERVRIDTGVIDNFITGPPLITELARAMRLLAVDGPEILPEWTFFPDNPFRFPRRTRSGLSPYAIHLYDHSWGDGGELRLGRRIVRGVLQSVSPRDMAVGKRRSTQLELRRLAITELAAAVSSKDR